jgi:tetratricopeptide (TPR) repeat protein
VAHGQGVLARRGLRIFLINLKQGECGRSDTDHGWAVPPGVFKYTFRQQYRGEATQTQQGGRYSLIDIGQQSPSGEYTDYVKTILKQSDGLATRSQGDRSSGEFNTPPTTQDHILLGDLHMRQGKHQEAVKAYENALRRFPTAPSEVLAKIYQNLAQASLAGGNIEVAKKWLDRAMALRNEDHTSTNSKNGSSLVLPAKLIVSTTKRLVDSFGDGKMNLKKIKESAVVEHLTFER